MANGSGGLRDPSPNTEGINDVPPPVIDLVLIGTVADDSRTQYEGPNTNVDTPEL